MPCFKHSDEITIHWIINHLISSLHFSSEKQETDTITGSFILKWAGPGSAWGACVFTGAQSHAPAGAHHAVPAQSHWAWDHLRGLRQHHPRHLHPPHDDAEPSGRPPGRLRCQVGQGPSWWALNISWYTVNHYTNFCFESLFSRLSV